MEQLILSLLIVVSLYLFIAPVRKRLAIVSTGKKDKALDRVGERWTAILQRSRISIQGHQGTPYPWIDALSSVLLGILRVCAGTFHHFASAYGWHPLGEGTFHEIYGGFVAVFAALTSIGIIILAIRRFVLKPEALGKKAVMVVRISSVVHPRPDADLSAQLF